MNDKLHTGERTREFNFTQEHFAKLSALSYDHTGIVVQDNKYEMFYSRLAKRVRALKLSNFDQYVAYLERHKDEEFTHFINALTTNLTSFFRENHHFVFLRDKVVPEYAKAGVKEFRVWSAGCSTGEETYSIAMTLAEATEATKMSWRITASDIDTEVLSKAQRGVYPLERVESIPAAVKKRWFLRGKGANAGMARVSSELQKNIEFMQVNLIKPFSFQHKFHVIFCRNVVIYFDRETKQKLIARYADSLVDKGYLIMGHSESLHGVSSQFVSLGQTIYQKVT
ncbi:protein-glutamate O-methyltransferase CheR [Hahella sp. KA22]|uniref:CheR family methyltransferase n=1 Tax=Hahella sp. KA22 TaxID=1628392 RepID=UPI000FDEB603|nr:protein-glutamate O-methyltransferase CheR [Hahella sp. KA22]AZZ90004.1 protein-glutamate O-methyltransferase CheR [Hahella sp. KA22]QAY53374.1 protein-glutamate O-methyltransferase CheR [Hahella sp. KA22]